jgi:ADP-ribosylglycohydrolase
MKIAPLAFFSRYIRTIEIESLIQFAYMTHQFPSAVTSAIAQYYILVFLLSAKPGNMSQEDRLQLRIKVANIIAEIETTLPYHDDKISVLLRNLDTRLSNEEISRKFGDGKRESFLAYNCFGITSSLFFRNPNSLETMYDAIRVGGDTDTNASIIASMLGALQGPSIFPEYLIKGLRDRWQAEEEFREFWEVVRKSSLAEEKE